MTTSRLTRITPPVSPANQIHKKGDWQVALFVFLRILPYALHNITPQAHHTRILIFVQSQNDISSCSIS